MIDPRVKLIRRALFTAHSDGKFFAKEIDYTHEATVLLDQLEKLQEDEASTQATDTNS